MSNVRALGNNNNLENIPHMLRNLARDLETGAAPMPRTLMCVAVFDDADKPPSLYYFGDGSRTLVNVGALAVVQNEIGQVRLVKDDGAG